MFNTTKYLDFLRKHYLFIIPILSLAVILTIFIINILNKESRTLSSDNSTRRNNEEIISPLNNGKTEMNSMKDNINYSSYQILNYVDKLFENWVGVFDYFLFNLNISSSEESDVQNTIKKNIEKFRNDFTSGDLNFLVKEYGDLIKKECNIYKLDWRIILSIIRQESYFNPNAVSRAGAFGLMQIMPGTGNSLQNLLQLEDTKTPQNNLIAGIYYFATLVADFEFTGQEKYQFALCSYNAGLGRTIDAMTITYFLGEDYKKWDNVKENLKFLSSKSDSIQKLVWPVSKKPSYGTLDNWQEPYKYVTKVIYYYDEYKKIFESNLPGEKVSKKSSSKKIKKSKKK